MVSVTTETEPPLLEPFSNVDPLYDRALMALSADVNITTRQAFEGVQIFGGMGSGKTSGSGRTLAHSLLYSGFGGLVLCAKPDEADTWRRYAAETGREDSFLFVDGKNSERFNFLDYELNAYKHEGSQVNNAVEVFINIAHVVNDEVGTGGGENKFWDNALRDMLRHSFAALTIAYGSFNLDQVFSMLDSAPMGDAQLDNKEFLEKSFCAQTLMKMYQKEKTHDVKSVMRYFRTTWGSMDAKLRSNLTATLSSVAGALGMGRLYEMWSTDTTFLPEQTHDGLVIVLDMPVKTWGRDGVIGQHIFKYAWQRATERRGAYGVPVFLWADEAHLFLSDYDAEFQSTARSSRAATIYLAQTVNSYYNALKGSNPSYAVKAMLANLKTKVFHANDDVDTNTYAAELIGKHVLQRRNATDGWTRGTSHGTSTSDTKGSSNSVSHGTNTSHTRGTNDSFSSGSNQSNSRGVNVNRSKGTNESEAIGRSNSVSHGTNSSHTSGTSKTTGSNRGASFGSSDSGYNSGRNWGSSKSETENSSRTSGSSRSNSASASRTNTRGVNDSFSTGRSETGTHGTSSTLSGGTSRSETRGTSRTVTDGTSRSVTQGTTDSTNDGISGSMGWSEQKDYLIEPHFFRNQLATHGGVVEAIVVQSGYGAPPFTRVRFKQ